MNTVVSTRKKYFVKHTVIFEQLEATLFVNIIPWNLR